MAVSAAFRHLCGMTVLAVAVIGLTPAMAQTAPDVATRVDRLEREMRAVQRTVFPNGAGATMQPEIQAQGATPGTGATTPLADVIARIDSLEQQMARLTGQIEQQDYRLRQLEQAAQKAAASTVPSTPEAGGATVPATPAAQPQPQPQAQPVAPTPAAAQPAPTAKEIATRRARVAAIEVPEGRDPAENAYLYGFRLWDAQLYPEAAAQLRRMLDQYPNHARASYAGNLLGRSLIDDGKPAAAVPILYDNYKSRPRGDRAADSLYYMGVALTQLNRKADACKTYDELQRVYGMTITPALSAQVRTGRTRAGC